MQLNTLSISIKTILKNYLLSVLAIIGIYAVFGCYYEEYADITFAIINQGIFTGKAENLFNNYGALTGIGNVYKYLYGANNTVPWYGIFSLAYLSLVLTNFTLLFDVFYSRLNTTDLKKKAFAFITALLVLFQYIILIQITKTTLMLAIPVLALLLLNQQKTVKINGWVWAYLLFCLVVDTMLRAEALFLLIIFSVPVLVIAKGFKAGSIASFKIYALPLVISLTVLYLSTLTYNANDVAYKNISAYKVGAWDGGIDQSKIKFDTKADSIKLYAFGNIFMSDTDSINAELFKKYNNIDQYNKAGLFVSNIISNFPHRVTHGMITMWLSILMSGYFLLAIILLHVFLLVAIQGRDNKLKYILCSLAFAALLLLVAVVLKMEERVMSPLLINQLVLVFILFKDKISTGIKFFNAFILLLIAISLFNVYRKGSYAMIKKEERNTILAQQKFIAENYPNKTVIIDLYSFNYVVPDVLRETDFLQNMRKGNNQMLCIDNGYIALYDSYKTHIAGITGSTKFSQSVAYLQQNKKDIIYISTSNRIHFFFNYCNSIYKSRLLVDKLKVLNGVSCYLSLEKEYNIYRAY